VTAAEPARPRRRYDSPVRRRQAAETRERIVAAGAALMHGVPVWNWRALTVRAVAARAGVNERTVYRYFATERELRDAVLEHLESEAGIVLEDLELEGVAEHTARILEYVSLFPLESRTPDEPTLLAAHRRQRDALVGAVSARTQSWPDADRAIAAAILDVLWSVASYERLVADWGLEADDAVAGVTWAIDLVVEAVGAGRRPRS
jgi:AcrR family transcriptional regulator